MIQTQQEQDAAIVRTTVEVATNNTIEYAEAIKAAQIKIAKERLGHSPSMAILAALAVGDWPLLQKLAEEMSEAAQTIADAANNIANLASFVTHQQNKNADADVTI